MTTANILSAYARACTGHFPLPIKIVWKKIRYSIFVPFTPYGQFTSIEYCYLVYDGELYSIEKFVDIVEFVFILNMHKMFDDGHRATNH